MLCGAAHAACVVSGLQNTSSDLSTSQSLELNFAIAACRSHNHAPRARCHLPPVAASLLAPLRPHSRPQRSKQHRKPSSRSARQEGRRIGGGHAESGIRQHQGWASHGPAARCLWRLGRGFCRLRPTIRCVRYAVELGQFRHAEHSLYYRRGALQRRPYVLPRTRRGSDARSPWAVTATRLAASAAAQSPRPRGRTSRLASPALMVLIFTAGSPSISWPRQISLILTRRGSSVTRTQARLMVRIM